MALTGLGPGAMHVEYIESPRAYKAREVKVSPEQYARLVAFIRASFERDAGGRPHRLNLPGYFSSDAFYAASDRYKFWFTCNDWVRKALTEAGVRAPLWAPFDTALFYQLQKINITARRLSSFAAAAAGAAAPPTSSGTSCRPLRYSQRRRKKGLKRSFA